MSTLDDIRYRPEAELMAQLLDAYARPSDLSPPEPDLAYDPMSDALSMFLRLTPSVAPRLCELLDEVRGKLGVERAVELFVNPDPGLSIDLGAGGPEREAGVLTISAGLVRAMNDQELRFLFGQKLGAAHYGHGRMLDAQWQFEEALYLGAEDGGEFEEPAMSSLSSAKFASWQRMAALSNDRAGLVAAGGDLQTAVAVFFRMVSGLGPEHLRFDISAFLAQLEALESRERHGGWDPFGEPITPIRVRALQLFTNGGGAESSRLSLVDDEVTKLLGRLDFRPHRPLDQHSRDFMISGGLLVAQADGPELGDDEWEYLLGLVVPWTEDPQAELNRLATKSEAEAMLVESTAWLRANAGRERFDLFADLATLAALDGRLREAERALMMRIAEMLDVPEAVAKESLGAALSARVPARVVRDGQRPVLL